MYNDVKVNKESWFLYALILHFDYLKLWMKDTCIYLLEIPKSDYMFKS